MKKEDKNPIILLLVILIILVIVLLILYYNFPKSSTNTCDYNSTLKTYIRTDPNCVINFLCIQGTQGFSDECGCGCEKIQELDCKNYTSDSCPDSCVVCPPCAACSSISCNTKDFCSSIGFNDTWYKSVKPN